MGSYSKKACVRFPLKSQSDDWLRKQQGLALPILPPTTLEARKYFFSQICNFAEEVSSNGKQKINFETFACQWNTTTDGKECFYVTVEVLVSYAKSWEKVTNNRASEELISEQLHQVRLSGKVFAVPNVPFPSYLIGTAQSISPMHGVFDKFDSGIIPTSLTAAISLSHLSLEVPILQQQQVVPANLSIYDMLGTSNMQIDSGMDVFGRDFIMGPLALEQ